MNYVWSAVHLDGTLYYHRTLCMTLKSISATSDLEGLKLRRLPKDCMKMAAYTLTNFIFRSQAVTLTLYKSMVKSKLSATAVYGSLLR